MIAENGEILSQIQSLDEAWVREAELGALEGWLRVGPIAPDTAEVDS